MNFNSLTFLLVFPVVLMLYWHLPDRCRWPLLLVASYFFYMSWNFWLGLLMLSVTLLSYMAGRLIERTVQTMLRKTWLVVTVVVCVGSLFLFKYLNFTLENISVFATALGRAWQAPALNLVLPVGISFYTFQTLSYVIDVYRKKVRAESHFGYYALYVSFFPQLVAGPIERPENLIPQLRATHKCNQNDLRAGLQLMLVGFCKKVLVADFVAKAVNAVYAAPHKANGPAVLIATVLFAAQIYCDFSGYSDIALGCARMMGVRLMENFKSPYSAVSMRDFWHRWHISLTSWFTDYMYKPLGGSRRGAWRWGVSTMLVFLISGLWHGAAWTFLCWGGIHGLYLVLEGLLRKPWRKVAEKCALNMEGRKMRVFRTIIVFSLVCLAWIFFRAETLADAWVLIVRLFSQWQRGSLAAAMAQMGLSGTEVIQIGIRLGALKALHLMPQKLTNRRSHTGSNFGVEMLPCFYLVLTIALAWLGNLAENGANTFIYFQF